jgi:V/A-type H+-transporting ATPase subunit I
MAVAPVKRIHIIAHESTQEPLLEALQDAGLVHIEPLADEEQLETVEPLISETREIEKRVSEVEAAVDYLGRFVPPQGFVSSLAGGKVELSTDRFLTFSSKEAIEEILGEVRTVQQERSDLEVRRTRLLSALHHLAPWTSMDAPIESLVPSSGVDVFNGSFPSRVMDGFRAALNQSGDAWTLEEVSSSGGRTYFVLVTLKEEVRDADRFLREFGFQPATFPPGEGTVASLQKNIQAELSEIDEKVENLATKARELAGDRVKLMAAYDRLTQLSHRLESVSAAHGTKESIVLSGWVQTEELPRLKQVLEDVSTETTLIERHPLPEEEPPVALANKQLIKPFRVVTNLYGLPKSREIDPTPLLAPFFVVSFGIAVGEGGYGVLLALLSKLGLKFLKLGEGGRRLLNLLFYCGIATFIAGVLMGSFFAIDFSSVPGFLSPLAALHDAVQLLNPLEDSLTFLGIVLGLGFFQVWLGVLVGGVIRWQSGDKKGALFHDGAWLVLLPLTTLLGRSAAGVPVLYLWAVAAASIFVSAGFGAKGVASRVGAGVYALYGLTGFFGDILSYSRLFALGLATGVIAMVVNILASMASGIPIVGWLIMVVLLVFGHLFNLAINALGAFIHTARLQFVEFFTKFFEGGGRRFVPFSKEFRFTTLVDGSENVGRGALPRDTTQ